MALGSRGRAGASKDKVDIESLERDNDRGLDALSERVGLLKAATVGIKTEVDSQHSLLDNMDTGMMNTRGLLGSVNEKFRTVMSNKQNVNMSMVLGGLVALCIVYWYFFKR